MLRGMALLAAVGTNSCGAEPVRLIIDTDMSSDVDDVAALCTAHALADTGEAEIVAVLHNTGLVEGAGAISVINHYYGRDDIPVGAWRGAFNNPAVAPAGSFAARSAGPYVLNLVRNFESPVKNSTQVPLGVDVYREVLAASPDNSVMISSIGFMNNLAALVTSPPDKHSPLNGSDLIARKVKGLGMMGGQYPTSAAPPLCPHKTGSMCPKGEWNMGGGQKYGTTGPPASTWSHTTVSGWPSSVPIMFSGFEMGKTIFTGAPLVGKCCRPGLPSTGQPLGAGCAAGGCAPKSGNASSGGCQPKSNPCRQAFQDFSIASHWSGGCPPRESWDPATTLWAVRGMRGVWTSHGTGHNTVDASTGGNAWVETGKTEHRSYLILTPGAEAAARREVAKTIDELMCRGPKYNVGAKTDDAGGPVPATSAMTRRELEAEVQRLRAQVASSAPAAKTSAACSWPPATAPAPTDDNSTFMPVDDLTCSSSGQLPVTASDPRVKTLESFYVDTRQTVYEMRPRHSFAGGGQVVAVTIWSGMQSSAQITNVVAQLTAAKRAGADIATLTEEAFGYDTHNVNINLTDPGPVAIRAAAKALNMTVVLPMRLRMADGSQRNAAVVCLGNGSLAEAVAVYSGARPIVATEKQMPVLGWPVEDGVGETGKARFVQGGEYHATPGQVGAVVYDIPGIGRIGVAMCFDVRQRFSVSLPFVPLRVHRVISAFRP
jgi:hypothetical protein